MKRITLRRPNPCGPGYIETVWATDPEGYGVFWREPTEGAYHQIVGTGQTPRFQDWRRFRRWLGAHIDAPPRWDYATAIERRSLGRTVDSRFW
jgi:hypothetical protein